MKKINKILKQLSDLYEFNRRIKGYALKKRGAANRVAEGFSPPAPTTPPINRDLRPAWGPPSTVNVNGTRPSRNTAGKPSKLTAGRHK